MPVNSIGIIKHRPIPPAPAEGYYFISYIINYIKHKCHLSYCISFVSKGRVWYNFLKKTTSWSEASFEKGIMAAICKYTSSIHVVARRMRRKTDQTGRLVEWGFQGEKLDGTSEDGDRYEQDV